MKRDPKAGEVWRRGKTTRSVTWVSSRFVSYQARASKNSRNHCSTTIGSWRSWAATAECVIESSSTGRKEE